MSRFREADHDVLGAEWLGTCLTGIDLYYHSTYDISLGIVVWPSKLSRLQ